VAIGAVASHGPRRALLDGILVEALNVKTALFFLAFLPQFVSAGEPLAMQLAMLGCICVALNTLVDVLAVFAAHRLLKSGLAALARREAICTEKKFSDHAPLTIDYDFKL
jgi:threonine/homoserine/homoserine lactone efflux protein